MVTCKVLLSFLLCIFINIFLNSFDVYSDTLLAYNSLTFNLGESVLLSGCQVCYRKEEKDVFGPKNSSCKQCFIKNYNFQCGRDYKILNSIQELKNKDSCEQKKLAFTYNHSSKSYDLRNEECNRAIDSCCVENANDTSISSSLSHLDKRILAYHIKKFGYKR